MDDAKKTRVLAELALNRPEAAVPEDPYTFRSGNTTVRVRFSGGRSIEEAVAHYLAMRDNADSAMGAK